MSITQILTLVALASAGVVAVGALRARRAMRDLYPPPLPAVAPTEGIAPAHDRSRPTAVVLLDHAGTEVSDFLLPYQLLSAADVFNVYAIAPEHRPATLTGGLDVMPDLSFAGFRRLPLERADLVVIPHLVTPDEALLTWVRDQADAGTVVLTICTGAGVAAQAGLLDGRRATAHWGDLARFERRHPDVEWVRGVRYVDNGDICSSAGITSGIDATLHLIRRLAGNEAMERAARTIGYTDLRYLTDPTTDQYRIEPVDLILPLTAAFGRRPRINVLLRDGVDETSVAAVMDVHAATCTARLTTLCADGRPVKTRHGLTLLPRVADNSNSPHRIEPSPHGAPFDAFRLALDELARRRGGAIARFAAKRLEYRTPPPAAPRG